jgi:hypothetical protein
MPQLLDRSQVSTTIAVPLDLIEAETLPVNCQACQANRVGTVYEPNLCGTTASAFSPPDEHLAKRLNSSQTSMPSSCHLTETGFKLAIPYSIIPIGLANYRPTT